MKSDKILGLDYPWKIESDFILALYPEIRDELKRILEKSGSKNIIISQLKQRINYLEEYKDNCVFHKQWFENYKTIDWLYAVKVKSRDLNLRIYFSFVHNHAVFLHAFVEKSKSDLAKAKGVAAERYKLIENGEEMQV